MPVDFLTKEQRKSYGRYVTAPSSAQLARYFHLDDTDVKLVMQHRGDHNRLGFALQLGTVRFLGTFLKDPTDVPDIVVDYLSKQLDIADKTCLTLYNSGQVRWDHTSEIKDFYGYHDFSDPKEYFSLVRWLYTRSWISDERPSILFDLATARLVDRKVLLPGVTVLARLVSRIRYRVSARLWQNLASLVNPEQRSKLEAILSIPEKSGKTPLDRLRRAPTRVSGPSLVDVLKRLKEIRDIGVGGIPLTGVPQSRLKALARYASTVRAQAIARMPADRRVATLLAFTRAFEVRAMDDALDLLDLLITDLLKKAQDTGQKERLRTIRDLDTAALNLKSACDILLDEACDDANLRSAIFAIVPKEELSKASAMVASLARHSDDKYYPELIESHRRVRIFLPTLLRTVTFSSIQADQPVLKALQFLSAIEQQRNPDMSQAPLDFVPKSWRRWIITNGMIDRRAYTLCVLENLQDCLRRRDVFVEKSDKWGNPQAKLLSRKEWAATKQKVCHALGRNGNASFELANLRSELDEAYHRTADNLSTNAAVSIEKKGGRDHLSLTRLDKLVEPPSLITLRQQVATLLPRVDLSEILLEINARTGFASEFTHINEANARVTNLHMSLCAVLFAEACNIGIEPIINSNIPALTRGRLEWVQQNYIRAETLIQANARLVEAQTHISLAQAWGGGEVASADGLRFIVPVRTINAGPNSKYFGVERGVTYYNFTSNQFTGFHGIVIPGTLRDSLYILEGLLEQETTLNPVEVMSDTAGTSDIIFGLFWLLGYQFSPRMADVGGTRFWRMDKNAYYGSLD
ncbi:MAG: hypothetical protein QG588_825, partial [Candidatus Poribacteria bacterium]|nr:hypothetical protein [Candidatus Poribacteria bacterium]